MSVFVPHNDSYEKIGPGENLVGCDLNGIDLSGRDLHGAKLSYAILDNANLQRANLSGVDLTYASMKGANIGGAILDGANLDLKKGEIHALLGPNGAGKTTLIKILATLLTKDSGEVNIMGYNLDTQENNIRHVVIGGDLLHGKSVIYAIAQEIMLEYFRKYAGDIIQFYVIDGNHDISGKGNEVVSALTPLYDINGVRWIKFDETYHIEDTKDFPINDEIISKNDILFVEYFSII